MLIRPGLLVAVLPVAPTVTGIGASLVSGTTIAVEWTGNDMPFGVTYQVVWSITVDGIGGGTVNSATSPQNVIADSLGSNPEGSFTVNAFDSGLTLIATANYTGVIVL